VIFKKFFQNAGLFFVYSTEISFGTKVPVGVSPRVHDLNCGSSQEVVATQT